MKSTAWIVPTTILLALATIVPLAAAGYDAATSQVQADGPVLLTGRADSLVSQSVASFVSSDATPQVGFVLAADEMNVSPRATPSTTSCTTSPIPLPGCGTQGSPGEAFTLTGATVTVTKALGAYKVVATNDASYAKTPAFVGGVLVATADGTSYLGATTKPQSISPSDSNWDASGQRASGQDRYAVDPNVASFTTSSGGVLAGKGGLQVLLQGLSAHVVGTKSDGTTYDKTLDLSSSSSGGQYLVLEAKDGRLAATSAAPLSAFGIRTLDLRGSASLTNVDGNVTKDGQTTNYQKQAVDLDGPLSFAVQNVAPPASGSTAPRLTLGLSSDLTVATLAPPEDKPQNDTARLVAAGAAGAGGAALLAGLLYFWPRVKFATALLFLPLYSRIERTAVLDHEKRDEIYELIRVSPGIHAHEIGEKAQIGWGTTVYHLKLLETHSLIVSKKSGRYKRFFVNTGEYTKKKDVYGALRNETAKAVADFIVNHPGCNQKELCAALNIQPSLASWHVEKLEGVELVKRVKDGRMVRYFAGAAWAGLNVQIHPEGGATTPAET